MIQFTYKGKTYNVVNHATVTDRLKQRELFELPLEGWKLLFTAVNGKADVESLRQILVAKVSKLEDSKEFEYKGEKLWWDKNTRAGLINLANSSYDNVTLLINNKIMEVNPTALKNLLTKLEVYSSKVFITTYKHLQDINKLQTIGDILNYDYTLGYPEKIVIE